MKEKTYRFLFPYMQLGVRHNNTVIISFFYMATVILALINDLFIILFFLATGIHITWHLVMSKFDDHYNDNRDNRAKKILRRYKW